MAYTREESNKKYPVTLDFHMVIDYDIWYIFYITKCIGCDFKGVSRQFRGKMGRFLYDNVFYYYREIADNICNEDFKSSSVYNIHRRLWVRNTDLLGVIIDNLVTLVNLVITVGTTAIYEMYVTVARSWRRTVHVQ